MSQTSTCSWKKWVKLRTFMEEIGQITHVHGRHGSNYHMFMEEMGQTTTL